MAQINRIINTIINVVFEVIDWKTHVAPGMGGPREVINKQIGNYDIFVGIMWKRFGTPTGLAESGTEEEFNTACANWEQFQRPRILFYFNKTPYMPDDESESEQFDKVIIKCELVRGGSVCLMVRLQAPYRSRMGARSARPQQ